MTPDPERPPVRSTRLHIALGLLLCLIVARTLVLDRETAQERETSEAITSTLDALASTKMNYSPDLITVPPVQGQHETKSRLRGRMGGRMRGAVAAEWRKLAIAHTGRAAEWRRLGITLALFHLPGGLDALQHVGDHFPPPKTSARKGHLPHGRADPFGHQPTPISGPEEVAMWQAIYGSHSLTPAQTTHYREMLARLRLGWFENVAVAHLYARAGMKVPARDAAVAAGQSVGTLWWLQLLNGVVTFFGIIGLFVLGMIGLATFIQRTSMSTRTPAATYADAYPPPMPIIVNGMVISAPSITVPAAPTRPDRVVGIEQANGLFPYPVLLLTLIAYLIAQESAGLVVGGLLSPFRAQLEELSSTSLLRLTQGLQLVAYIPIVGIPLLILRRKIRFDPLTGKPMTWRKLLSTLGFRTKNPVADVGVAAVGYLLITPLVLLATVVSHWLFARFHTPQNPAAVEMLAAQHSLDRWMLLFVASVAAPFVEETMFRGILYSAFRSRMGVGGSAALSGAIFAIIHPTLPGGFLPIWVVGVGLALVFEWRKSLLPGMVLHGIYNGVITLVTFAIFAK